METYEYDTTTGPDCQPAESPLAVQHREQRDRALRAIRYRLEGPAGPR